MVEYNLDWLKKKGFFKKRIPLKVKGKEILVDRKNLLAYVKVFSNKEIEIIKRELLSREAQKVRYIWFFFPITGKLKVFRRIGEVKWFYYSARLRSDYLKSRIDKLNKFSPNNMNVLFDIRDIVEKFYWQLWKHRILMARSIKELKEDKNKLLAVQHLIDRLIFFYFLAQLKLVKVKNEGKEWVLDRKNTREFFKWICDQLNENDLQKFLNKIFFDVLGQVKESGFVSEEFIIGKERFSIVSPCLNGGLFVEEEIEGIPERKIKISGIKKLILEVLNNYNWIIGEEFPEEEDVIGDLTPEIIGHIYEKFVVSLEQIEIEKIKLKDIRTVRKELRYGRKKIGAYYTPEEITNYISMNTIYPYIRDRLREKFSKSGEILLDNLFKKDNFNRLELKIIKYLYFEILTKIKICDNACGSGSFLIAAGNVLLRLYSRVLKILEENLSDDKDVREVLKDIKKSPTRNYYIVRQITVNNLYGVDIMEGAVEIAKLRFWLWLISQVDPKRIKGKRIETLPNLDFNLMVGNSLIGFVNIEDIEFDFIPVKPKKRWDTLISKQYLITTWTDKDKIKWLRDLAKQKQKFKTLPAHEAIKLKEKLNKELKKAREFLNEKFYNMLKTKGIKISQEEFLKLKPFHWGFEFYEIFNLEKPKKERGFDVIIGNPPYGNILNKNEKFITNITFYSKNSEIAGVFVERSVSQLKHRGYFAYIMTYAITFNKDLSRTREILWKNFMEVDISSFDRDRCRFFEGMSQSVSILLCKSKTINGKAIFKTSRMFREMPKSLNKIKYSIANEFLLIDSKIVPSAFNGSHRLPKLGEKINVRILKKLIDRGKIQASMVMEKGKSTIWIRTSGNYWYNSWDRKPYDSSEIKDIRVEEKWKNFIIILMNSSLFYWWFRIWGDGRHMNIDILKAFPLPLEEKVMHDFILLDNMRRLTMTKLFDVFEKDRNRFKTSEVKNYLDIIDLVIGRRYYGLNPAELLWVMNTDFEVRGGIKIPFSFYQLLIYLNFLDTLKEETVKEELIEFIDKQIIDSLVYELYLKENFEEDRIKTNLLELVESYLKDISNLSSDEQKLQIIKKVVEEIKNDRKIMEQIEKIKNNEWVKVIEGKKR